MGVRLTKGAYCYIECDERYCSRIIESHDKRFLRRLARLSGWKQRGREWMCRTCVEGSETSALR